MSGDLLLKGKETSPLIPPDLTPQSPLLKERRSPAIKFISAEVIEHFNNWNTAWQYAIDNVEELKD
ncbi:MAG: hypothetical protein SFU87_08185 [Chitinophagaceae bacterium]|nr:hypothetical protein [Chitinophagaceae bacterium]